MTVLFKHGCTHDRRLAVCWGCGLVCLVIFCFYVPFLMFFAAWYRGSELCLPWQPEETSGCDRGWAGGLWPAWWLAGDLWTLGWWSDDTRISHQVLVLQQETSKVGCIISLYLCTRRFICPCVCTCVHACIHVLFSRVSLKWFGSHKRADRSKKSECKMFYKRKNCGNASMHIHVYMCVFVCVYNVSLCVISTHSRLARGITLMISLPVKWSLFLFF